MTDLVVAARLPLSLLPRIVFYTTAIFFLPSLVLGMVSPVVVKLALADLERTGGTVGSIYAFSTVGSIFGTFLTGFWLISWLGTRTIVWVVAAVSAADGLAVGEFLSPASAAWGSLALTGLGAAVAFWLDASGALVGTPWRAVELFALPAVRPRAPSLILAGGLLWRRIATGSGGRRGRDRRPGRPGLEHRPLPRALRGRVQLLLHPDPGGDRRAVAARARSCSTTSSTATSSSTTRRSSATATSASTPS